MRDPHPAAREPGGDLAIRDATIYTSPEVAPIAHGTLLVRGGRIAVAGAGLQVPEGVRVLPCEHCTVTAGFWNTHIHFTEPKWNFAAWKPAATLNAQLQDMLTSRGFTTVVDAGSDLAVTLSLRRRIEGSGLLGPAIYTAGEPIYPPHGIPYYLRGTLPFFLLWSMPQPATPAEAARVEERNIREGADLLKLFTGSYIRRGEILPMPVNIAHEAADVAHRHGQLVYSHPSNAAGIEVAIESGVDVLAHAPDTTAGVDVALVARIVARRMAMIPTLRMFATTVTRQSSYLRPIYSVVREFNLRGGELLFGTDVGYMTDYDTTEEFRALAACGLNAAGVLRMLTTAPAGRFGVAGEKGVIAPGKLADVVVLDDDPERDLTAFARVRYTIRGGRLLYARP